MTNRIETGEMQERLERTRDIVRETIAELALAGTYPQNDLDTFSKRVESLVAPDVSDDGVIHTGTISMDNTPTIVVRPQDEFTLDESSFGLSKERQDAIFAHYQGNTELFIRDAEGAIKLLETPSQLPIPPLDNEYGDVVTRQISFGAGVIERLWTPGSIIRVRDVPNGPFSRPALASIVHQQLTLVDEDNKTPYAELKFDRSYSASALPAKIQEVLEDMQLRRKLKAAHLQHAFESALIQANPKRYSHIHGLTRSAELADLIKLNTPDDPYAPSDAVKRALNPKRRSKKVPSFEA